MLGVGLLATGSMFTDKLFTGQREMAGLGIYHYGARFYSPKLGRFISADTIVPGSSNPQAFNRYSYVLNNPLRYTDPTGHEPHTPGSCYESVNGVCGYTAHKNPAVLLKLSPKSDDGGPPSCPIHQAFCLGRNWLTNQGSDSVENNRIVFNRDQQMTQELMISIGVREARTEYILNGGAQLDRTSPPDGIQDTYPYKADLESLRLNFIRENWTTTFIGSYTVTIVNNGDDTATFTVYNTSGLKSITHNPLPGANFRNPSVQDF